MRVNWRGVFPAATTQFAENSSVDLGATGRQLVFVLMANTLVLTLAASAVVPRRYRAR